MENNGYCIVAGGAGFLGSHICKRLLEQNKYVICVDNLISGNMINIEPFLTNPKFKFIQQDISDLNLVNQFNEFKITEIYNFACIASPKLYKLYPLETLTTCFNGSLSLLNLAKKHNSKYIFASTSEVYGDPLIHPQTETYYGNVNTVGERSCYDEGKRVAETLVYTMRNQYNINAKIIRIFNTYGPNMSIDDGRVITNFIQRIMEAKPVQIYGNGNQTRSFCYVDDLIDGIFGVMESDEMGPVNLGNPDCEFTLNELVKEFEEITGATIDVEYLPATENDPQQRKPDIELARNRIGFSPKIGLREGLKKTIIYFYNS
jgi:UDP-glucuronate decarboxylase